MAVIVKFQINSHDFCYAFIYISQDPTKLDSKFNEAITYIEKTMLKFGPFDVLGFSQVILLNLSVYDVLRWRLSLLLSMYDNFLI